VIWPWIIAINYRFAPAINPVLFLFALNVFLLALILFVLYAEAKRDHLSPVETIALGAFPALYGNLVWLLSTGMEHLLLTAAAFLSAHFLFSGQRASSLLRVSLAGFFFAVAMTTRTEAAVLLPLYLAVAVLLGRRRNEILCFLFPCAGAVAFVIFNNYLTSHSMFPVTLGGRKWLYFGTNDTALKFTFIRQFLRDSATQFVHSLVGFNLNYLMLRPLKIAIGIAVCFGVWRLIRLRAIHVLFLLTLALANYAVYCVLFPSLGHGMRYQAMALVFVLPLIALGLIEILQRTANHLGRAPRFVYCGNIIAMLAISVLGLHSLYSWSQITDAGIKHINGTHVRMGKWLSRYSPENATIAAFDIGAIGYFSNRRVVDIGGLVDPKFLPYLFSGQTTAYLRERGISWIVLPEGAPEALAGEQEACVSLKAKLNLCNGVEFTKKEVMSFYTPEKVWRRGFEATWHALNGQVLYEITWHHASRPEKVVGSMVSVRRMGATP
jgi:hypothetical protein